MPFPSDVTIILHAGAYKTATSTIQTLMMANRDQILEQYGILYPLTATRRNTGSANPASQAHHLLFHVLRTDGNTAPDPERIASQKDRLSQEIASSGSKQIVLSSELFASAPQVVKAALVDMLGEARLKVLYTVRRPDDYLESMQNQSHKNFRKPTRLPDRTLPTLRNLREWEALIGRENLQVLAFPRGGYTAYLPRVFAALGLSPADPLIDPGLHDNPAMTLTGLVMRRTLAARLEERSIPISRDLCHRLNVELDALETGMPKSPKAIFLTRKDRRVVMKANQKDVKGITRYMSGEEAERLETDMAAPILSVPRNVRRDLTVDDMVQGLIEAGLASGFLGKTLGQSAQR